jgi:anoctamin-8
VRAHESTKQTAFYVSGPKNVLFKAAEEYRLAKRLRPELGGALRDFTTRESHCFEYVKDFDDKVVIFTSQERQWLVFQVLQGLRATPAEVSTFKGRAQVEEGQSIVAAWQNSGLIHQIFPLHEMNALSQLKTSWVKKFFTPQPLGERRLMHVPIAI